MEKEILREPPTTTHITTSEPPKQPTREEIFQKYFGKKLPVIAQQKPVNSAEKQRDKNIELPESQQPENIKTHQEIQILNVIGTGSFGTVYKGMYESTGREVALKHAEKDRLLQEAKIHAQLGSHPNIITLETIVDIQGENYGVMPLMKTHLNIKKERTYDEKLNLAKALLSGLAHSHSRGIVHCDLKPENILEGEQGDYRIGDFGLSSNIDELVQSLSRSAHDNPKIIGNLRYMAPEVRQGQQPTTSSDIFSISALLYEIFTGNTYDEYAREELQKSELPEQIKNALLKGLSKREERYENASEMIADFSILNGKTIYKIVNDVNKLQLTQTKPPTLKSEFEIKYSPISSSYYPWFESSWNLDLIESKFQK